jgi:hypothetical protein
MKEVAVRLEGGQLMDAHIRLRSNLGPLETYACAVLIFY